MLNVNWRKNHSIIYRSTFNDISLCKIKKIQPQKKGPGMLWGWSYVMPMTLRDIT